MVILGVTLITVIVHFIIDSTRWQLVPLYLAVIVTSGLTFVLLFQEKSIQYSRPIRVITFILIGILVLVSGVSEYAFPIYAMPEPNGEFLIGSGGKLTVLAVGGDEGGEIQLAKPETNSTIVGGITIDVNTNKLRIFESDFPNRGGYWDITTLTAGVGTNLAGGAAGSIPYQTAAATTAMLAKGTDGQVLTLASGLPSWASPTGITTLTAIGSTANANGATISGTTLNLEPANANIKNFNFKLMKPNFVSV